MRYFITGGAGFFGQHLTERLLAAGHTVTIYDRVPPPATSPTHPRCTVLHGDILDAAGLERAIAGHEVVIHNAAVLPIARAGRDYRRVNVDGTRNVLQAARGHGVRKCLFISTSAVYGIPRAVPITEATPLTPLGNYGWSKHAAEQVCCQMIAEGLDVSIIRPRTILGPGRVGIFSLLFDRIARGKRVYLIGAGTNLFQLLSARDLAAACALATEHPCRGEDFNLGAAEFGTIREDLQALIRHAGSASRLLGLPAFAARWALTALDWCRLSPLVDWHYKTPHKPFYFDIGKAHRLLGWIPHDSNRQMLCAAYDSYRAATQQGPLATGTRHTLAVNAGVLQRV